MFPARSFRIPDQVVKIVFKFHGGNLDGTSVRGNTDLADRNPAWRYLFLTDGAQVGKRFREVAPQRALGLRKLIMSDEARDALKQALESIADDLDPEDLPTPEELRDLVEDALAEQGFDEGLPGPKSLGEFLEAARQLDQTYEVYEVIDRKEGPAVVHVQIQYVGDDAELN